MQNRSCDPSGPRSQPPLRKATGACLVPTALPRVPGTHKRKTEPHTLASFAAGSGTGYGHQEGHFGG
jgi:hypothetical protein